MIHGPLNRSYYPTVVGCQGQGPSGASGRWGFYWETRAKGFMLGGGTERGGLFWGLLVFSLVLYNRLVYIQSAENESIMLCPKKEKDLL